MKFCILALFVLLAIGCAPVSGLKITKQDPYEIDLVWQKDDLAQGYAIYYGSRLVDVTTEPHYEDGTVMAGTNYGAVTVWAVYLKPLLPETVALSQKEERSTK